MAVNSHYIAINDSTVKIFRRSDNGVAFAFRNNPKGLVSAVQLCRRLINEDDAIRKTRLHHIYNNGKIPTLRDFHGLRYSEEPLEPQIIFRRNSIFNQRTVDKILSQYPDGWT